MNDEAPIPCGQSSKAQLGSYVLSTITRSPGSSKTLLQDIERFIQSLQNEFAEV
jgi:hypothetical protein